MPLSLRSWKIRASCTALGVIAVAALAEVTATGAVWTQFAGFVPAVCIVAALADALTAALLLSYVHYAPRRLSTKLLVVLFGGATLDAIAMLLCRPSIPGGTPLIHVSSQAGTWLDVGWQMMSGIAALAYAYLRNSHSDRTYSRRATIGILTLASGVFVAVIAGMIVFGAGLPVLAIGATFTPAFRYLVAPLIAGVTGVAGFAVLRARNAHFLDRAFGYAMLAMMLGALLTAVAGERFSPAWYLARMLFVGTTLLMLAATMRKLFASRLQVRAAERTLEHARTDVMRHAQRMQALWRISEKTDLTDEARLHAVLDVGVKTLRPGSAMEGYICHLVQSTVVVDAVAHENGQDAIHPILSPGASFDLERSMQSKISAGAGTCVWNDLGEFHSRNMICKDIGWHSFIGTPLQVGRTLHFLIFGSPYSMDAAPFQQDDVAFMDVLGTFLAHQLSSRVQLDRIQYQIEHDALTGLRNRTQFRTALRSAVALNRPFAMAYLDLDRFRAINEMAGNMIGDELLVEVAVGLSSVAERDFVARTSGDGFAIIMPDALSTDDVTARVAQYKELFRIPFHTGDREGTRMLSVTSSFGVAVYPDHGPTADDLVRSADVALDIAKERGGDVAVFFEPAMGPSAELRYAKSIELSEAIEAGGLMLAYQPTFVLDTCRIVGSEALVRWNHPERGVLPPGEFIAFAERNGLIGRMTRWVIDRAIRDLSSMPSIPHDFRCYVNLSMAQIDDLAFIAELEERLRFVPRIAEHLGIEITETAAITNTQSSMYALERFRKLGMRVAIDDFGTGYSSLSYLKRLPVDVIKIDRSFITGLPTDEKDGALCELLLQIASRFGLTALAEGIETFDQLSWLRQHGCSSGQGFLIAKPLPFGEMTAMLARDRPPAELRLAR